MKVYNIINVVITVLCAIQCVLWFKFVLDAKKTLTKKRNETKRDFELFHNFYLNLVDFCDEEPIPNITLNQIKTETKRLKVKLIDKLSVKV